MLLLKHQGVVKAASVRCRAILLGLTHNIALRLAHLDVHESGAEALGLGPHAIVTRLRDDGGCKQVLSELILRIASARRRVGLLLLHLQLVADEDELVARRQLCAGALQRGNVETLVEHVHALGYGRRDRRSGLRMLNLLHYVDVIELLRGSLDNDLAAHVHLGVRACL